MPTKCTAVNLLDLHRSDLFLSLFMFLKTASLACCGLNGYRLADMDDFMKRFLETSLVSGWVFPESRCQTSPEQLISHFPSLRVHLIQVREGERETVIC